MSMTEFGTIGYAAVSVFYAILSLLLLTSWRGRNLGGYLIAACMVSVVWAAVLAIETSRTDVPALVVFGIEILRGGAWLTFLIVVALRIGVSRNIAYVGHAIWIGVLISGFTLWFGQDYFGPIIDMASVLIPGGLMIALAGLMLIEQLYRNSPPGTRWGIKGIVLGLGGLFAYDLFLYSQGLLFGVLDQTTWAARGAVNILFVPLIAIAAKRSPDWDLNIFVSRQVVFYSTSLIAVGLYMLLMSLGGYALLLYGGTWGGLVQVVFFVGAGLVLVILLFSSTLRARLKVFLSKHFFQNKYDYREEWLRLVSTLAGFEDSSTKQIVVRAIAQIVESPAGILWVRDAKDCSYKMVAQYGSSNSVPDIAADDPLVNFIEQNGWLIDLGELSQSPKQYGDLSVPSWLSGNNNAWLIVPLVTGQELLGLVMLTKAPGPPKLNYEDRDLLKTVGSHIAVHLAQERSDNMLAEAQQFEAYNRLTAFLMHDLNNLIAQQSLIVKNAEKHRRNPDFIDDAIETIANSVDRMKRVMEQLRRGKSGQAAKLTDLNLVLSAAVELCVGKQPQATLDIDDASVMLAVDAEQFTMVLMHLIRNAQDATPTTGTVIVSLRKEGDRAKVSVSDTGTGMTPEFVRDRLFRPFDSTKGSQGMGIGAYQAREFARKMGGELSVDTTVSRGTTVTLILPLGK